MFSTLSPPTSPSGAAAPATQGQPQFRRPGRASPRLAPRLPAPTTSIPLQPEVASPLPRHVCRASSGKRAAPGPRPSHAQGPWMRQRPAHQAPKNDLYRDLFSALATQFAKESLPWIKELVEPLWAGNPEPLTDTLAPEELADADSQFSMINNVKIHYKTWTMADGEAQPLGGSVAQRGDEEAPAVLMLHGFNGSVFNWRLVAQEVAEGVSGAAAGAACTSVAFDRPPFGLSGRPVKWEHGSKTDPYTLSGGVELVRSIIKQLGLKRVVLVGHSSGAPIALEVAAQCPELVAGLVLVAPAVAVDSKGFLSTLDFGMIARFAWTRMLLSFDGPGVAYVRQQIKKREEEVRQGKFGVYADDSMFATPQVIDELLKPLRAHDWDRGSLNVFRSMDMGPPTTPWENIRAPILVVQGGDDAILQPEHAHTVTHALREARLRSPSGPSASSPVDYVELPQCGHLPMEEKPTEFTSALVSFITRHCMRARPANATAPAPAPAPPSQQLQQQQQQLNQLLRASPSAASPAPAPARQAAQPQRQLVAAAMAPRKSHVL